MSKQVNFNTGDLHVNTSLLKEYGYRIRRVILHNKGAKSVIFYRYPEQAFNDPDFLDSITLAGYKVRDLIIIADMLKDKDISSVKLDNYISGVKDGYSKAQKDFEEALKESINKIIERA